MIKDPNCSNEAHSVRDVEQAVLSVFFQNTSRFQQNTCDNVEASLLDELLQQKKALEQKIKRLYSLYGDGGDELLLATIDETKAQLQRTISKIENEEEKKRNAASRRCLVAKVSDVQSRWASMSAEEQRDLLHEAIRKVTITHDKINIDFNL